MRKNNSFVLLGSICLIIALMAVGFASACGPAEPQVFEWRFQTPYPMTSAQSSVVAQTFVDQCNQNSDGRLTVELYPPGAILGTGAELYEGVSQGVCEAAISAGCYLGGILPLSFGDIEYYGLPVLAASAEDVHKFWWEWRDGAAFKLINEAYNENGVVTFMGGSVVNLLGTKFPVSTLDDLEGRLIYSHGILGSLMEELGASPVKLASAELYTGLQRGTVEGYTHAEYVIESYNLKEVVEYLIVSPSLCSGTTHILINIDAYNELPKELQEVVEDAALAASRAYADVYEELVASAFEAAEAAGVQFITLPDTEVTKLRALATPLWEEIANKTETGRELLELMKEYYTEIGAM